MKFFEDNFPDWLSGVNFKKTVTANGGLTITSGQTLTLTGVTVTGLSSGVDSVIATNANAFLVGQTSANPALNIDTSTASSATGLNIASAAAGGKVAVSVLSSGSNESVTFDAKGTGTVFIGAVNSGVVQVGGSLTATTASFKVQSSLSTAVVVGPNGGTNPVLQVDGSASSSASGISIKGNSAGFGVYIQAISSNATEDLHIDPKSSARVTIGSQTANNSGLNVQSANATSLTVGPNGNTTPVFQVDSSTASAVAGINIKGAATAGTVAITTTDSGSNTSLTIASKGIGTITFNPAIAATAGGASNDGVMFGSLGVGLFTGTGTPTFSAMNGSIYVDSNATTTTTRIYVNKSGAATAGTTWTNLTTAA